ncbi:MAG TPA: hypothetical protein V6D50_10675 [Chroococcales cyanobacterium]
MFYEKAIAFFDAWSAIGFCKFTIIGVQNFATLQCRTPLEETALLDCK